MRKIRSSSGFVELKSLEDIWHTTTVTLIQVACLWRALNRIRLYAGETTWLPFERPLGQLAVYVTCFTASVCLLPVMVWCGIVRIGVYANDRFKLGVDLDTARIVKNEFVVVPRQISAAAAAAAQKREDRRPKSMIFMPASGGGANTGLRRFNSSSFVLANEAAAAAATAHKLDYFSDTTTTTSSSSGIRSPSGERRRQRHQRRRTPKPARRSVYVIAGDVDSKEKRGRLELLDRVRSAVECRTKWKNFMPVSSLIHLIIAMCLLFPNVLLVSKQIQYGLRPKGYIHHTELDFVFSRPLQRFSETNGRLNDQAGASLKLVTTNTGGDAESSSSLSSGSTSLDSKVGSTIKYKLISALLEDNDEIKYEPQISLELVNFALATLSFAIHYASPLWHLNKCFSMLFSAHLVFVGALTVVAFASFEVLVKFETVFAAGIRFANINGTFVPTTTTMSSSAGSDGTVKFNTALLDLPFLTTPFSLCACFVISFLLCLLSSAPIYSFALNKYKYKYEHVKNSFLAIIENNRVANSPRQQNDALFGVAATNNDELASNISPRS